MPSVRAWLPRGLRIVSFSSFLSFCSNMLTRSLCVDIAYGTTPEVGAVRIVELATLTGKDTEVTGTWTRNDAGKVVVVPW